MGLSIVDITAPKIIFESLNISKEVMHKMKHIREKMPIAILMLLLQR